MKRYLLFADHDWPEDACGGWGDFLTSFDSLDEAREFTTIELNKLKRQITPNPTGWSLVDLEKEEIIENGDLREYRPGDLIPFPDAKPKDRAKKPKAKES